MSPGTPAQPPPSSPLAAPLSWPHVLRSQVRCLPVAAGLRQPPRLCWTWTPHHVAHVGPGWDCSQHGERIALQAPALSPGKGRQEKRPLFRPCAASAGTWPSEPRFPASLKPWEHPAAGPRAWERVGTGSTSAGGVAAWVTVRTAVSRGPLPPRQAIQPLVWEHSHLNLLKLRF